MALVLFGLGNHFTLSRLRRLFKRVLPLSIGEVLGTFFIVFVGLLLVGESPGAAILLGALAIATAPATTILVLKEMQSEGPISEYTGILVALNNLISIIAFEVIFVAVFFLQGDSQNTSGSITAGTFGAGYIRFHFYRYLCRFDDQLWKCSHFWKPPHYYADWFDLTDPGAVSVNRSFLYADVFGDGFYCC